MVTDSAARPPRPARSESREALELQSIREQHPELTGAVDMHLELLALLRRIQGRVTLPMLDLSPETLRRHQAEARPLLRFEETEQYIFSAPFGTRMTLRARIEKRIGVTNLR